VRKNSKENDAMRKLSSARGLEIIAQGAAQYRAIFEESANPFKVGTQDVERKLWLKGWLEAKFKWEKPLLDRKRFAKKFTNRPFVKR
jgi:hypothetical protein